MYCMLGLASCFAELFYFVRLFCHGAKAYLYVLFFAVISRSCAVILVRNFIKYIMRFSFVMSHGLNLFNLKMFLHEFRCL